jgi:RNA polymerase sigma factor (sigma-70 family)
MGKKEIYTRKTLIERIRDPYDQFSWREFYNYYKDYIFVIVVNMGVSHHDAEELLQNILLKAWKAMPQFEYSPEKGKFRWWLTRITKNEVFDHLKRKAKKPQIDTLEDFAVNKSAEIDAIIEREWSRFISEKAWKNIATEFSQKYLDAFMALAEGKSITEAADSFGIEEATLYVYKGRIKKRLCREIATLIHELDC